MKENEFRGLSLLRSHYDANKAKVNILMIRVCVDASFLNSKVIFDWQPRERENTNTKKNVCANENSKKKKTKRSLERTHLCYGIYGVA